MRATRAMRSSARAENCRFALASASSRIALRRARNTCRIALPGISALHESDGPAKRDCCALARDEDALANVRRALAAFVADHVVEGNARDLDLQIDAVEQRPGEFADVLRHCSVVAAAFGAARSAIAARARIHRGDELKARRIRKRSGGARDRDAMPSSNGWRMHLDRAARELGEFVEEKHAVMRERDFARLRECAAAD